MTVLSALEQDLKNRLTTTETALKAKVEELATSHKVWAGVCVACTTIGFIIGKVI